MNKIMSKEYQEEVLTLLGTVLIHGLMVVAVKVLKDVAVEANVPKKGPTYRVYTDEFEDILGEDKIPKDKKAPKDKKRPPKGK